MQGIYIFFNPTVVPLSCRFPGCVCAGLQSSRSRLLGKRPLWYWKWLLSLHNQWWRHAVPQQVLQSKELDLQAAHYEMMHQTALLIQLRAARWDLPAVDCGVMDGWAPYIGAGNITKMRGPGQGKPRETQRKNGCMIQARPGNSWGSLGPDHFRLDDGKAHVYSSSE